MIVKYNNDPPGNYHKGNKQWLSACSKPEYYDYIKQLFEPKQRSGLSQAALETLAIIAYNRPITKAKLSK